MKRIDLTSRLITVNGLYTFDSNIEATPDELVHIIGRYFKTPEAIASRPAIVDG